MIERYWWLIVIMIFFCSIERSYAGMFTGPEDMKKWNEWSNQTKEKYKNFIGLTKDEILAKYGKPHKIEHDVQYRSFFDEQDKKWTYQTAEEKWSYQRHTGIKYLYGNVWWDYFYFNDGKVVKAENTFAE